MHASLGRDCSGWGGNPELHYLSLPVKRRVGEIHPGVLEQKG